MKASLFLLLAQATGLTFHTEDATRPTTKVVKLLQGMQEQLESEAKADEETYDKFKCWCHDNTVAKEKAVKEAKLATTELQDRVEILLSKSQRLKAEVEKTEDEVAKNQEGTAFLQSREGAAKPLQTILAKHSQKMSAEDKDTFEAFLQRGDGVDGVMGVLTGLKDDFSAEITKVKEDEATPWPPRRLRRSKLEPSRSKRRRKRRPMLMRSVPSRSRRSKTPREHSARICRSWRK